MIPTNKKLAILHPYLTKKWWAVNMMIYLSNFLQDKNNDVTLYAFSYNKKLFPSNENNFKINYFKSTFIVVLLFPVWKHQKLPPCEKYL